MDAASYHWIELFVDGVGEGKGLCGVKVIRQRCIFRLKGWDPVDYGVTPDNACTESLLPFTAYPESRDISLLIPANPTNLVRNPNVVKRKSSSILRRAETRS